MNTHYEIVKQIGIAESTWQESIERHDVIQEEFDGICFYRVAKKIGILGKGTIITQEGIIFDFPHIARILHLENGISKTYAKPFYIEEKVDGYNVRVARIQGRVLAFSRSAYVCPFSTDRIADFLDTKKIFNFSLMVFIFVFFRFVLDLNKAVEIHAREIQVSCC